MAGLHTLIERPTEDIARLAEANTALAADNSERAADLAALRRRIGEPANESGPAGA